jgi:uncharacterized membrane protein YvlD (DUF360 family)
VDNLTTSDKLILGGGIVYLIAMFMPWWGLDSGANNGWDYFLGGWIPLILIAVLAAHVAVTRFSPDTKIPDLPIPWSQGYLVAGVAAAVIVVLRLIIKADVCFLNICQDLDRKFGLFIAVIAAICVAAGSVMKGKEDDAGTVPGGDTGTAPF